MSQATQSPPTTGEFCWYEINTPDLEAAKKFYGDVFGWTFEEIPMDGFNYPLLHKGGMACGGMMHMTGPQWEGVPPHWMSYIAVDDVDASAAKVKELGGGVCVEPMDIPNVGRMAVVNDPDGATFSLFKSASEMGPQPDAVVWNEVYFKDQDKTRAGCTGLLMWYHEFDGGRAFYTGLLEWTTADMDMGPHGIYTLWNHKSGKGLGGGMKLTPEMAEVPPCWANYVGVENVDETLAKATAAGATVTVPAQDIPDDKGRFAMMMDPTGAHFAIYQPGANTGS